MTVLQAAEQFRVEALDLSALETQETAFQRCLAFLEGIPKAARQNLRRGSYGLKHVVENPCRGAPRSLVPSFDPGAYVYQGTFILAALASGFTMGPQEKGSLRATFNICERGLRQRLKEIIKAGGLRVAARA